MREYDTARMRDLLERIAEDGDRSLSEFFECYIDPEGPFRYSGSFDAWDAVNELIESSPDLISDAINDYARDSGWVQNDPDDRGDWLYEQRKDREVLR
jgi:hypothetical protein